MFQYYLRKRRHLGREGWEEETCDEWDYRRWIEKHMGSRYSLSLIAFVLYSPFLLYSMFPAFCFLYILFGKNRSDYLFILEKNKEKKASPTIVVLRRIKFGHWRRNLLVLIPHHNEYYISDMKWKLGVKYLK